MCDANKMVMLGMVLFGLSLSACGGGEEDNHDHNHDHANHDHNHEENHANHENHMHGGEELVAEGCEHMKDGPEQAATAVADGSATLEDITAEHTRIDVTLADYMGMKGGFVRYEAAESGDFVFFVDSDVAIEVLDADNMDSAVAFEEMGVAVDECAEVAVQHTIEFEAGKSYKILLGPTDAELVKLVIEHGG